MPQLPSYMNNYRFTSEICKFSKACYSFNLYVIIGVVLYVWHLHVDTKITLHCFISSCLMRAANYYLERYPHLSAFSVETIERRVYETESIYSPLLHDIPGGRSAMWIKGLRYKTILHIIFLP